MVANASILTDRSTPLTAQATGDTIFLPRFCDLRMVLVVVVVAQLLAFVMVLVPTVPSESRWSNLSLISLFIQWLALTSAGALCMARPRLAQLPNQLAGVLSYALVLVVVVAVSETAFQVAQRAPLSLAILNDHAGFLLRTLGIASVIAAIALRYLYVQHQWKQQIEAEARAREDALQARIRPHFLFNSLNTIAALTRSEPAQAEEAVEDLADLFRATLSGQGDRVSLQDEIDLARRYVHMESLRLGERLHLEWDLGDLPLHQQVPPLVLQPLLENAIYHGVERLPQGGTVRVYGYRSEKSLLIEVSNPLPAAADNRVHRGNGIALDNIRQRLLLCYGPEGGLEMEREDGLHMARLRIPEEEPR